MKNSRKTAVLLAALLSVSLCACGQRFRSERYYYCGSGVRYARQCGGKFADG